MDEPTILKFPTCRSGTASPIAPSASLLSADQLDLQTILAAWNDATDRLQRTHETLREEVRRLSDELEAKNRELARKNRLADLGQMASHVAHEVRNSLVPMKLYLSLLRRRFTTDGGSLDILDKVLAGFTALESTVGDLLHFSSQRDPHCGSVGVATLLREVCQSLAPQLDAQNIRALVDCPPSLVWNADANMLRRALLDLVLNALDVLPSGGEIVLTAVRTPAGLEIEVADSGPGVPAPLLDRLFEPFFTTKPSGTGLGLAIVERIAAAHGGRVAAANCPEGGAAFTLTLPQSKRVLEKAA
jgi:signal transduction histidine kinase